MSGALRDVAEGSQALPFVRLFYGQPSQYLWADDTGTVHHVDQGEGGVQGDALMPVVLIGTTCSTSVGSATVGGRRAVVRFPRRCVRDHSQSRHGGSPSTVFWTLNCIVTPESACGTREASAQNSALSWRGWHNKWTQVPGFGGDQICRQRSKASPCWAHLLAGRSLFTHS